jgi:dTDP-4-amino-4,6-dideoxygalactose transaminase
LPGRLAHRRRIYALHRDLLANVGTWQPLLSQAGKVGAALLYPLLVENREQVRTEARDRRIELSDWFKDVLHPRGANRQAFGYRGGTSPTGEAAACIVNLPTHTGIREHEAGRVGDFLTARPEFTPAGSWQPPSKQRFPESP